MANTSPRITRSASKRLLEGHDVIVIHAQKRLKQQCLVHKDVVSTKPLSKEEQKLFHFDHWHRPKTKNPRLKALVKRFHTYAVPFVRKAYRSIRRTGNEDLVEVLKDDVTFRALFHFVACLKRMKEYSLCMKALRADLSTKLNIDGTAAFVPSEEAGPSSKPEELNRSKNGKCRYCSLIHARVSLMPSANPGELETSGNGKAVCCSSELIEGDNQFSIKVYNVLLILNEMLTLMGFQSEDVEGIGHAELTGIVEDRMNVLKTEIVQEDNLLIELINSVYKSECVSAADKLRSKLRLSLKVYVHGSAEVLSSNKKIYTTFPKLVDFLDSVWHSWHIDKNVRLWQWPSRAAFEEWKKEVRSNSKYFPNRQGGRSD